MKRLAAATAPGGTAFKHAPPAAGLLQVDAWPRTAAHSVNDVKFHTFLIFFPPKIAYKKKIRRMCT
jgi:hypothetical protein